MLSMTRPTQLTPPETHRRGRLWPIGLAIAGGLSLVLACLLSLNTLAVSAADLIEADPSAFVRVGDGSQITYTIAAGGRMTVPVQVSGAANLAVATIRLAYRPDSVHPINCVRGAAFDTGVCNTEFAPGQMKFNVMAVAGVSGTHTLYDVVFQGVGGTVGVLTSPLTVTVDYLADVAGNSLTADTLNGAIVVVGQPDVVARVGDAAHHNFTVAPGTSVPVTITLNITGAWTVGAATLVLNYDPAVVRPTACTAIAPMDGGYCNLNFNPAGQIKLSLLSAAGLSGTVLPYAVSFAAAPGAPPDTPAALTLAVEHLADPNGMPLAWQTISGTIAVAAGNTNSTWLLVGAPGEAGAYTATLGLTTTASLWVSDTHNLGVASWALNYNPAVVRALGCTFDRTAPEIDGGVCALEAGRIRAALLAAQGLTGTRHLLDVVLTPAPGAVAGQTSPLTLTVSNLADSAGQLMPARVRAGTFSILPGGVGVALVRVGDTVNNGRFEAPQDDRVVVPIRVEGVANLGAASLALAYDPSIVQPLSCTLTYTNFNGGFCNTNAPGAVHVSALSLAGFTGTTTLFDVVFRPAGGAQVGASSLLTLTASNCADPNAAPLLLEARGGQIVITQPLGSPQVVLGTPDKHYQMELGQVITVPITATIDPLKAPLGLGAATLIVDYDPALVRPRACVLNTSPVDGFDGGVCNLNYAPGRIKFNALSADGIMGSARLIDLALVGQALGSRPLTLTVQHLEDVNANPLTYGTEVAPLVTVVTPTIQITKSVTPLNAVPYHGLVTYTIVLSNPTPLTATPVTLTDVLPPQVAFGQWLSLPVTGVIRNSNALTWTGALATTGNLTFTFTATHTGAYRDVITNTARLQSATVDRTAAAVFTVSQQYTLTALNSSPTTLGKITYLTATLNAGGFTYTWNLGDGATVVGPTVNHLYAATGVYTAQVTATNGVAVVNAATPVTIANVPPIANAGTDQSVDLNTLVILDGAASSDPDGHMPLVYGWTQSGGSVVLLSSPTVSRPTFTAPLTPTVLTFTLVVTDARGLASAPDTTMVEVGDLPVSGLTASNSSPTRLANVTFFTATISAGSNVTYHWAFGDGQTASGPTATHFYVSAGVYTAVVTATNKTGSVSASTRVTITNQAPSANAGVDQTVLVTAHVTLDGAASTEPDGHLPLLYGWTQSGGPTIVLSSRTISRPTFTALATPAVLTFTLIVTDTQGLASAPDEVVVTVNDLAITGLTAINSSPTRLTDVTFFTATINVGSNVTYQWAFGEGQTASGATAAHSYAVAGVYTAGVYTAVITATNQQGSISATTRVTITNQAPIANAGRDQISLVSAPVTLDGSGSVDPDGHLPLTYGWTQTGGPAISLSSVVISQPEFTVPITSTVLTFTLIVTDALGLASAPDTTVVVVNDVPPGGLQVANSSPVRLGRETWFTATISAGTNVTYQWTFGDGQTGQGAQISHRYGQAGFYIATVTALNGAGAISATTPVTINRQLTYLPLVINRYVAAPDLIVEQVIATRNNVQVVIRNRGDRPVVDEFWVDVYVNPTQAPTRVNQTWPMLGNQGLTWGVTATALSALRPGGVLTLTLNDAYFFPDLSHVVWPLPTGTVLYAQVDSANATTTYGAVLEGHEILGLAYNNVRGPVVSAAKLSAAWLLTRSTEGPSKTDRLPVRPW